MTTRIAQISDTHLSVDRPFFNANFDRVAEVLRASRPDLVVNSGDLALDGADSDGDLALAAERHLALGIETRCLAGNHDVGDDPHLGGGQPVDAARIERWRRIVGPSFWSLDVPGWRLVGIDALVLGTDLPAAAAQADALRAAAASANGRALALFLHKPMFDERPDETIESSRFLLPHRRAHLVELLAGARPALVACGHVHQYRDTLVEGVRHLWAPGTSFLISDPWQPAFGAKTVGYLEHRFHADGSHDHRLVAVRGLAHHDLADFPQAYGDIRARGPNAS